MESELHLRARESWIKHCKHICAATAYVHILAEDNNYQKQLLIITSDTDKAVQVSEYAVIGIQQATDSNNQQYVQ